MKKLLLAALIIVSLASGSRMVQTGWEGGSGLAGPVPEWDTCFESCSDISWLALPGQLSISSLLLADPVLHGVDPSFTGAYTVDVGDINGDGLNDIVGGGYQAPEFCAWYADGGGNWNRHTISTAADSPCGCDLCDIDQDGDLDVLCATYSGGRLLLFLNEGGSTPSWTQVQITDNLLGGHDVEASDMDGDGDPDILAAAADGNSVAWWRNDGGDPIQWHIQEISCLVEYPCRIQAVDLDCDGCMDVVASMWEGDEVAAWYGTGGSSPSWTKQVIGGTINGAHCVRACDVDMDGYPDLIVSAMDESRLLLLRNDGSSPVHWTVEEVGFFQGCGYARPGDIDGDGDQDIVASSFGSAGAAWYENTGGGDQWTKHTIVTGIGSSSCSMPADIDNDGDLDALITYFSGNCIVWFELTEFASSGTLTSSILDIQDDPMWSSVDWDLHLPGGTSFSLSYRTSDNPSSMGAWSAPLLVPSELSGVLERYFQYRIELETSDPGLSPVLRSVGLNWDPTGISGPGTASDAVVTVEGGNPSTGAPMLHICSPSGGHIEMELYDLSGRGRWSWSGFLQQGCQESVLVPELPSGSYRLAVRSGGSSSIPLTILR